MSSERLPQQPGEWIDRSRTIRFSFEGREYTAFAGDTISSAIWAHGVRMLGRSFKYHRPRGIYSMANHDVNCVVEDGNRTNIRADVIAPVEGARYTAVNTFGGLAKDKARFTEWFSRFLPVGFYYKAFHTPRKLFPFYERKMRAVAGLGKINPNAPRGKTPKSYDWCDVLVVGAGPTGLSVAITAAEQGTRVIIVDENPHPGGSLGYAGGSDPRAAGVLKDLLAKVAANSNISLRTSTEGAGLYADNWVALVDPVKLIKLRTKSVIVAGGAAEQPAIFGNNDLPGVMLGSAAQRLIARFAVRPFRRGVVLTANSDGYAVAHDLVRAGIEVAAIVDLRKDPKDQAPAGVTVYTGHAIHEAVPTSGKLGIRGAVVGPVDSECHPTGAATFTLDCDGIAMSVGWMPSDGLINMVGGRGTYNDALQQFIPHTLPKNVYAAGRTNGIYDLDDKLADGRRAALEALGQSAQPVARKGPPRNHKYPVFTDTKAKCFVDLDEDVQVKDIKNAVQEGFDSVELVKRYVTVGMGPSQGKIANANNIRILAKVRGKPINETGVTTSRPFYHPVHFGHLAGRSFHPHRHTAMHSRHIAAGAQFMPAGAWLRPAYYTTNGRTRDEAMQAEVKFVRESLGMIDVGTLGKIDVSGPDAAEFIERMYTGRFAKMKTGTTRYLLMTDESGVIIDDGVAARLAEDRFYVTATTTGADGVYREMQRWAMIWGLNVTLANATGQLGAMNLAGPYARTVLSQLTDIDLSQEAFPYLGVREGVVAGVQARLMRVGFVGELGYEIHVPTQEAAHVWDRIMQAGARFNCRPFGVEAQRILRLEKGHIIIGQDTDGLTHPFEAACDWAVKMDKPFFIGQRSLQVLQKKPINRALVGFNLAPDYSGPIPKECHLVIRDGTITGRVTSVVYSPTLGRVLGLAYVAKDQAQIGGKFTIRVDGKKEIQAEVVKTPFYDPDSRRQTELIDKPKEAAA